jgi:enamine deaminase RidA (YjgF/YER057c/UK114 family)
MSTDLQELFQLCNPGNTVSVERASQEELDELGLLLDRLEQVEIYLDSTLTTSQRKDALAEFDTLTDRINLLVEKV